MSEKIVEIEEDTLLWIDERYNRLREENKRLKLIIKAIKAQCDVTQDYEMNEYIRQLENEKADSKWLKRVAGSDKE